MSDIILVETLKKLVASYGLSLTKDERRLERLLLEYCAWNKREINALIAAIRYQVVDKLVSISTQQVKPSYLGELMNKFQEESGLPNELAKWTVSAWVDVLNVQIQIEEIVQPVVKSVSQEIPTEAFKVEIDSQNRHLVVNDDTQIHLVYIPAGEFLMGSSDIEKEAFDIEKPQHKLYLPGYYISKHLITNSQYEAFRGRKRLVETAYTEPVHSFHNHPVVGISWDDSLIFCQWLSTQTGVHVRLPTEAEWEKAARGVDGYKWPWGNQVPDRTYCNSDGIVGDTTPVGSYSPKGDSPFGCSDMSGNVWEWTYSLLRSYPYDPNDGREDPQSREDRVLRGGSYHYNSLFARCTVRVGGSPDLKSRYFGMRIVVQI